MKAVIDEKQKQLLEEQHLRVQEEINKLPEDQQKTVKGLQALVNYELEENNKLFFSDEMFAVDDFLKKNGLPGDCKESLMTTIEKTPKGGVFVFYNKSFIKTYNNLVFSTTDYIRSLELTIAEQVQYKEVKYTVYTTKTKTKRKSSGKQKTK